jgi:iron complex outermembrane receptor protein
MPLKNKLLGGIAALAMAGPLMPSVALAQGQLEEIVVTAQRRAESVQTVPIAVSAFNPGELQRRNITSTLDVVKFVPNLLGHNNTGPATSNTYFMRALGNSDTLATIDLPVATYFDEVVLSRQNANQLALFTVDRIEVLRGPQGTLFGRNVTGGAIAVYLQKPQEEIGGSASLSYGRFSFKEAKGTINVPLSPKLLTQVSAYYNDNNGYVTNVANNQKLNDAKNYGARLAVRALPNEELTWDGSVTYMNAQGTNLFNEVCDTKNLGTKPNPCPGRFVISGYSNTGLPPSSTLLVGAAGALAVPGTVNGKKATFDPQTTKANTWIGISNLQWAGDGITVNAITGYVRTEQNINFDLNSGRPGRGAANPGFVGVSPITLGASGQPHPWGGGFTLLQGAVTKQFTQEVKATGSVFDDRLKYVAGFYYFDENSDTDIGDIFSIGGTNNAFIGRDQFLENGTEAWAGYAQFDYKLTDQFTATAGIRYTDERKSLAITDRRDPRVVSTVVVNGVTLNNRLDTANLAAFGYPTRQVAKVWTPRFALNYQLNDDVLLYASATRGFRSGGWNARGGGANAIAPFFPEKVWSYEGGVKSEWLDNRLRLNVNAFHMDVKQFQFPASFVAPGATAPSFITQNDADLRNQGVEVEAQAVVTEGLNIFATLGYQHAKYRNLGTATANQLARCQASIARNDPAASRFAAGVGGCAAGIITYDGKVAEPARTPPWTASIGVNYEYPLNDLGVKVVPNLSAAYSGSFESAAANLSVYRLANGTYSLNEADGGEFAGGSRTSSYWLINASLAVADLEDTYRLAVECTNCFGKVYNQSGFSGYSFWSPPGTWRVTLSANF